MRHLVGTRHTFGVVLLALTVAAVSALSLASFATAGTYTGCSGAYDSGQNCYINQYHSLESSEAFNAYGNGGFSVATSALNTDLTQRGSWYYGAGYACHPYSGDNYLYPWIYNSDSRSQTMYSRGAYGVDKECT